MSLVFNERALDNLLQSADGPVGLKLQFVADDIQANYDGVVAKVWENQSALVRPTVGQRLFNGDDGLQAEIGISEAGRIARYMGEKFHREDWVVPAIMAGWDNAL